MKCIKTFFLNFILNNSPQVCYQQIKHIISFIIVYSQFIISNKKISMCDVYNKPLNRHF